jgi:translocation and assembly module TamB
MRRLAKWFLVSLVALLISLPLTLSTHFGQSCLLRLVSIASGRVQISGLAGSLLGEGTIAAIRLRDDRGIWAEVKDITFDWRPWALLSGRLAVDRIRVAQIDVLRRPMNHANTAKESPSDLAIPLQITLGELDIRAITLSDDVIGERLALRLLAAVQMNGATSASEARLELHRIDGHKAHLTSRLYFEPDTRSLNITIEADDPEGGLVSRSLGLPERTPVSMRVASMGPLDAWTADLSVAARGTPFLAGTARLNAAGDGTHRLTARLSGFVERLVPDILRPALGGQTDVAIAADIEGLHDGAPRRVRQARVSVTGHALQAQAIGGGDLLQGAFHGAVK